MLKRASQIFGTFSVLVGMMIGAIPQALADIDCNQSPQAVDGSDSSQRAYFVALLARAQTAPIEDFLKLWYPERNRKVDGAYFLNCEDEPFGTVHTERAGCAPDVLYSWQTWTKLSAIIKAYPDGQAWDGPANTDLRSLWATISAVSTYAYGGTVVRLKIKPGTTYVQTFDEGPNVIAYPRGNPAFILQDFIITNQKVIESYSYDTPELYDEVVKDILRIASGKPYINYSARDMGGVGMQRVYTAGVEERGPQDESTLRARLTLMISSILHGQGKIAYSSGACRNRQVEYSTDKPTYINTYGPVAP